ncbi:MAG: type I restriction-modification system subunit M [Candidatus Hodarchaeales archaeon]
MANDINGIEKQLWKAADELRANSKMRSSEYSTPVLGLIFLRYADFKFNEAEKELKRNQPANSSRRQTISKLDYQARGVMYLPEEARWETLMNLPEEANIGKEINDAMRAVERENDDLKNVLPKTYNRLENQVLFNLLKNFNSVPMEIEGDAFGKIYEYFMGNFALAEGQLGGEFYTPTSIVKLIVEIIEPYHGRIYDPACGSGGMFVQSGNFVKHHKGTADENGLLLEKISIYGQERIAETVRLCKMNLAVHGLSGDIRQANSYYEDLHNCVGKFDFVMANPPFNVNNIDKDKLKDDTKRFPFGMPNPDNGNYVWIQLFYSALNENGRAGFVMANSASDAAYSEKEIRKQLIDDGVIDVMVSIGPNFFYTVTLPCMLWFLDKKKKGTDRESKVLFLDARNIYTPLDRAHKEFSKQQLAFLANIVHLYREEDLNSENINPKLKNLTKSQIEQIELMFNSGEYQDVAGLCKVTTRDEIKQQRWSLNPGRYVGLAENDSEKINYIQTLSLLDEQLIELNQEAKGIEKTIHENIIKLLGKL